MIFVTIGTQAPFDRLIEIVDKIAPTLEEPVIAQALNGKYVPSNIETIDFISPEKFNDYFSRATLVIAHAGMGTIISALTNRKPLIIFPRKAALGEHRNEHQTATAIRFKQLGLANVAFESDELEYLIKSPESIIIPSKIGCSASNELIESLTDFILDK